MKRKHKNMIILALLVIALVLIVFGFNKFRYNNINEDLISAGIKDYPVETRTVGFRTIRNMKSDLKDQLNMFETNIEDKKTSILTHFENDIPELDLEDKITQVEDIDSKVETKEEYDNAMAKLSEIESSVNYELFSADIKTYLEANFSAAELGNITIGITDLTNSQSFTYNEDLTFYSASTIKVPMAMYIYDLIAAGEVSLDDTLVYESVNYEGGTGIMQADPVGSTYTVDELLTNMIVYSDNIATDILKNAYFPNPDDMTKELEPYWGYCNLDNTTARECSVTNHITSLEYLYDHAEAYPMLIEDMLNSEYKNRIPKYIEDDVDVANKVGSFNSTYIDDAIVYAEKPYAISIAFEEIDNSEERMALLSEQIYNSWNKYFIY